MTGQHALNESYDGITDHPIRAALALLALGLVGPVITLHGQVGQLLDAVAPAPPPRTMPDTVTQE
ncbi:hypothetical protein [Streptomyces sp. NPDC000405]|uniref:hypothetical protein n=1 Tax=Streptomyces sp. NPDC000405 TaxID=3161033 RepID=UPI00398CD16F